MRFHRSIKRYWNIFSRASVYTWNGDPNKGSVSFSKWRKANRLTPTGSIAPFPRRGNYTGGYDSMIFYGMEKPTNREIGFLVTYAHTVAPMHLCVGNRGVYNWRGALLITWPLREEEIEREKQRDHRSKTN